MLSVAGSFRVALVISGAVIALGTVTGNTSAGHGPDEGVVRGSGTPKHPVDDAQPSGQQVFEAQKCSLCHSVAGKGNAKGPLDGVGSKYSAADLKLWITNPAEMGKKHNATRKPPMKSFASLPAADVDALVTYLLTLKK